MKALSIFFAVLFALIFMPLTYAAKEKPVIAQPKKEFRMMNKEAALKIQIARDKVSEWSEKAEDNASELTAEARKDINNKIARIHVLTNQLEDKVRDLGKATSVEWNEAKNEYQEALERLENEYQKLTKSTLPE